MFIFGLEGSGFFLSIMFTLLMSGAIVFFLISKIRRSEALIEEQGAILSHALGSLRGGAAPEAVESARALSREDESSSESDDDTSEDDDESSVEDVEESRDVMNITDEASVAGSLIPGTVIMSVSTLGTAIPNAEEEVKTIKLEDVEDLEKLGIADQSEWRTSYEKDPAFLNTLKVPQLRSIAAELTGTDVKKLKKGEIIATIKENYKPKEEEFNVIN